jgi:hypothetical protein
MTPDERETMGPPDSMRLRVQAASETASEAPVVLDVPDEARDLLHAAVESLGHDLQPGITGVAPVLGAGVIASVIGQARRGRDAESTQPPGSRIDARG